MTKHVCTQGSTINPRRGHRAHTRPITMTDLPWGKDTVFRPQPSYWHCCETLPAVSYRCKDASASTKTPSFYRTLRNVAGAIDTLERVRAATVCRCGVCPVLDDARRELALLLPAAPSPVAMSTAAIS